MRCLWSIVAVAAALQGATAFVAPVRPALSSMRPFGAPVSRSTGSLKMSAVSPELMGALSQASSALLAYTDDTTPTLNGSIIGVSLIGTTAALVVLFSLLSKNLASKSFAFELTEQESAAVNGVNDIFDATEEDKKLTESGTVGYVKRREIADAAKASYQQGKMDKDVRDRTLYYAEVDLNFLAALLRAAAPQDGEIFVDLGSGVGKAVFAAGALYPRLKKAVGVEYLPGLHQKAGQYQAKYRRLGGAPAEFVNADFTSPKVDVSNAGIIFAYATKYLTTVDGKYAVDVSAKCAAAPVGARIITLDRQLKGPFKLIKTLDDPSGDLMRVKGFVYERIAD